MSTTTTGFNALLWRVAAISNATMLLLLLVSSSLSPTTTMVSAFSGDTISRREMVVGGSGQLVSSSAVASGVFGMLLTTTSPSMATAAGDDDFMNGPGGIQYKIIKEGTGPQPVRAQQVKTEYTLWTGGFGRNQVDSSKGFLKGPLPVIVGVGRVIKGWDLMLLDMKLGETRQIIIPPSLGYGEKGAGGAIPPNATLYFEVEIIDMQPMPELSDDQKLWLENNPL